MKKISFVLAGGLALFSAGAYAESRYFNAGQQTTIDIIDPNVVAMKPSPINPAWILSGNPVTTAAEIARTSDTTTKAFVWRTTAGSFHWFYAFDEVVHITDGEAFITDEATHIEHRLGPGDVAFFPVGARTTWRVPDHVRKIATIKNCLPGPVASVIRWARMAKAVLQPASAYADQKSL